MKDSAGMFLLLWIGTIVGIVALSVGVNGVLAQQRPGDPPEPIVIEVPYTPERSTFQVGAIDATDFVVQTRALRFCVPSGHQGTLVLQGCK